MNPVKQWPRRAKTDLYAMVAARLFILAVTIIAVVMLFPFVSTVPLFELPREGDIAVETIIAPFTFDVEKLPQDLANERAEAGARVLLVLDFNQEAAMQAKRKLIDLRTAIYSFNAAGNTAKSQTVRNNIFGADLSESAVKAIRKSPTMIDDALAGLSQALEKGILDRRIIGSEQARTADLQRGAFGEDRPLVYDKETVTLRRNSSESVVRWADIPSRGRAVDLILSRIKNSSRYDSAEIGAVHELLMAYTAPDVFVNVPETSLRKEKSVSDVLSIKGKVFQETEIIRKHQVVTADILEKLYSFRKAQEQMNSSGTVLRTRKHNLGILLLLIITVFFIASYISVFHRSLLKDNKKLMAIAGVLIVQAAVIRLGLVIDTRVVEVLSGATSLSPEYIIPATLGAILTAIFFDLRISMAVSIFASLYIGLALGANFLMTLMTMTGGFIAGYVTKNIRYRFDFVKAIPPIFAIYAVMIFIFTLVNGEAAFSVLLQNWGIAAVNCCAAVFLSMILTMVFEGLFDVTSNMTLIELSDMNHPILKRLSIEAAGTYNHSVLVGNLAESAAERIGANSLFARVASYYHDIGKIDKASYFIENMTAHEKSKHTKLSPNLSALIISSHVKDGADLAKKYKLPRVIRDAIMQHHGTSTVSYFYEKAREQNPHKPVQEELFRYAGPLPQTRENAIIMLADSVEAASRSLATSSPKLLRDLVKKIIHDKFSSAQLDQSNLTLRDLDEIVEGFMPILQGIFHTRDPITKERR
jgi:putative nucleotidyltransferase with HDIG domain